jgi:superfamily II DNA or RNA helicase
VCFYIGLVHPRFLFLLDMGAGKTKIVCDLITHQQRAGKLDRALVTVPRLINLTSWREDIERHSDLEPNIINVTDIEEKWERLLTSRADVSVIDLAGLQWALCKREKKGKARRGWCVTTSV